MFLGGGGRSPCLAFLEARGTADLGVDLGWGPRDPQGGRCAPPVMGARPIMGRAVLEAISR